MVDSSLSHAAGYFEGHLGILPAIFCGNKTRYFSWIVWPSPSVIVATKTGILSQTMMFSKPWPSVFVPEPNQSISTSLWQQRDTKSNQINRKFQHKEKVLNDLLFCRDILGPLMKNGNPIYSEKPWVDKGRQTRGQKSSQMFPGNKMITLHMIKALLCTITLKRWPIKLRCVSQPWRDLNDRPPDCDHCLYQKISSNRGLEPKVCIANLQSGS